MATLRSMAEKESIVSHCVELEKSGGDVLGYLRDQNYLTPRATWFNFQREWLGRKPYQYTDGKPKKEGNNMAKPGINWEETVPPLMDAIRAGQDPRDYLTSLGCKNQLKVYQNLRQHIRRNHPELAQELPNLRNSWGKTSTKPNTTTKPEERAAMEQLQLEAGKNYELKPAAETEQKDVKPLTCAGFTVRCIEGDFGRFYYDAKHDLLDWTTLDGDVISYTPECWKVICTEQFPKAMALLGVKL